MGMLHGERDYIGTCRCFMRKFTATTADCFEAKGMEALNHVKKIYLKIQSQGIQSFLS